MSQTCVSLFNQTFCMRTPTETESGIILILTLCIIAGRAMHNRSI